MNGTEAALAVDGLRKAYRKKKVLNGLSFRVDGGEAVAILGSNGAGKSTLLGCLTGDRVPDSGAIRICGADPFRDPRQTAACLGFVPEHPFLYGELTVGEMLRFIAEARGLDPQSATSESARLLELFTLLGAEDTLCRELSQGMARKVAIIGALLHDPRLLILDEVFNGLDRPSTDRLLEELSARRSRGVAILVSSHDLHLLAEWCDWGLLLAPDGARDLRGSAWDDWCGDPSLAPSHSGNSTPAGDVI